MISDRRKSSYNNSQNELFFFTPQQKTLLSVLSHFWLESHVEDDHTRLGERNEELIDDIGDINMCLVVMAWRIWLSAPKNRFFVDEKKKVDAHLLALTLKLILRLRDSVTQNASKQYRPNVNKYLSHFFLQCCALLRPLRCCQSLIKVSFVVTTETSGRRSSLNLNTILYDRSSHVHVQAIHYIFLLSSSLHYSIVVHFRTSGILLRTEVLASLFIPL